MTVKAQDCRVNHRKTSGDRRPYSEFQIEFKKVSNELVSCGARAELFSMPVNPGRPYSVRGPCNLGRAGR